MMIVVATMVTAGSLNAGLILVRPLHIGLKSAKLTLGLAEIPRGKRLPECRKVVLDWTSGWIGIRVRVWAGQVAQAAGFANQRTLSAHRPSRRSATSGPTGSTDSRSGRSERSGLRVGAIKNSSLLS